MSVNPAYVEAAPSREEIDALRGPCLLEFGANWCGHCQAAQPVIAKALAGHPDLAYLKVEDGPGRPLGRSFRVKLWPTLIFLVDGQEVARCVRPDDSTTIAEALAQLGH